MKRRNVSYKCGQICQILLLRVNIFVHAEPMFLPKREHFSQKQVIVHHVLPALTSLCFSQLAFLPFAYVMDSWRWKLFTGEIDDSNMNEEW